MLRLVEVATAALTPARYAELLALGDAAYEEPIAPYLRDIGPGLHLLGLLDDVLVSHLMLVPRTLYAAGRPLRAAYVELVATHPDHQRRGHATTLLHEVPRLAGDAELAALSPSDAAFYARLGWTMWRGPLSVRRDGREEPTPDEELMVLRLAHTPGTLDDAAPLAADWRPGEVW